MASSIFVSIASYKDAELAHTISSLILNSSSANKVRIVVLLQCDGNGFRELQHLGCSGHVNLRCIQVNSQESQGVCWARAEIQKLYNGEDYYLQLDSHTQFTEGWDTLLINDHARALEYKSAAIITTYLPAYKFVSGARHVPAKKPTNFFVHTTRGLPQAKWRYIVEAPFPPPAYFYSGHFAFSTGDLVGRVPYDPELFFIGEEITMAIRAYSAGYILCAPRQYVAAHLYKRVRYDGKKRKQFWDGKEDENRTIKWWQRDIMS